MKLNKYQQEAVNHMDGPCLVTAVPGGGKTRVLTERTCALIKKGISQKSILCITFTNKAAKEMKDRISKKLNLKKLDFFVGTFHALCAMFLRKVGDRRGYTKSYTILDDQDQKELILKIARQMEVSIDRQDAYKVGYLLNYYRDQLEDFDYVISNLNDDILLNVANNYLERCREDNLIDFSGLIYETIKILEENDDIRNKVQEAFKYILVDETQDTNQSQFHFINLLGEKWKNIMFIGDHDQSIYFFRGARPENLQRFVDSYENCKRITLSKNYRSTPQIIKVASNLIRHNISYEEKKFETDNKDGAPVKCYEMENQYSEADWLSKMVKKLKEEGGWDYRDVVVLYRMNKQSEPLEQALSVGGIPYEVIGSRNFYDRKEVKFCLSMLKMLVNRRDDMSLNRVCTLIPGIGDTTIGKIEGRAKEKKIDIIEACREIGNESGSQNIKNGCNKVTEIYSMNFDFKNPSRCLKTLVDEFDLQKHLNTKYPDNAVERYDNVQQIIESCSNFDGKEDGVEKYLQKVSLVTANDKETEGDKVSLMTIHSAKGLEFPIVFLISVEQGIIPHERSIADDPIGGMAEEMRVAYVGISRAGKLLYITYCKKRKVINRYGKMTYKNSGPSEFLQMAGLLE